MVIAFFFNKKKTLVRGRSVFLQRCNIIVHFFAVHDLDFCGMLSCQKALISTVFFIHLKGLLILKLPFICKVTSKSFINFLISFSPTPKNKSQGMAFIDINTSILYILAHFSSLPFDNLSVLFQLPILRRVVLIQNICRSFLKHCLAAHLSNENRE